jgi:hypothetical protein
MKHMVASLTIGACLLLSSAGVVFAANAHNAMTGSGTGAPGITNGTGGTGVASCGSGGAVGTMLTQGSPPGQVGNLNTNSPFPTSAAGPNSPPNYAGAGTGNYGAGTTGMPNPHANSQYDNACLRQVP